jgi:hypothetical protein
MPAGATWQQALDVDKLAAAMPTSATELLPPARTGHLRLCPVPLGLGPSLGCATQAHCLQAAAPPCLHAQDALQTTKTFCGGFVMRSGETRNSFALSASTAGNC